MILRILLLVGAWCVAWAQAEAGRRTPSAAVGTPGVGSARVIGLHPGRVAVSGGGSLYYDECGPWSIGTGRKRTATSADCGCTPGSRRSPVDETGVAQAGASVSYGPVGQAKSGKSDEGSSPQSAQGQQTTDVGLHGWTLAERPETRREARRRRKAADVPCVILLHGHSLDRRMWDDQVPALAPCCRVIRVDLRGYGRSSDQVEGQAFVHADDVVALMDSLHIGRAHVVGLSMGSFIAGDLLAIYPDRLLSCTLASGGIRRSPGPSEPADSAEWARREAEIAALRARGVDQYKREWIETLIGSGGSDRERMRDALTRQVSDWTAWQPLHHEARCYYGNEAWDSLRARRPEVPVLMLTGANERKARSPMLDFLPNGRALTLPNCGHMMNMDQPEAFNRALLDFLSTL